MPKHTPIPFRKMANQEEYTRFLHHLYQKQSTHEAFSQLWHTPSELFSPWYGKGIAEYLCQSWARDAYCSQQPLIIYEIGAGNGTLCRDILDYLCDTHAEIYSKLVYNIIEISHTLSRRIEDVIAKHPKKIVIHQKSFLEWNFEETKPCFVLAMEVLDNLPQDLVRFNKDGTLEHAFVLTNEAFVYGKSEQGRYTEIFQEASDPLIIEMVNALDHTVHSWPSLTGSWLESLLQIWPFSIYYHDGIRQKEFIPTGPYLFLKRLAQFFPKHKLLISDFDSLPDRIPIYNGPVVQTRFEGMTVACSTYLLQKGLFDIFFSLDFAMLSRLYALVNPQRSAQVMKHANFCQSIIDPALTRTRSGYNPLLEDFRNVSVMLA